MPDPERAEFEARRAELEAENARLEAEIAAQRAELGLPQTPAEWREEATRFEAQLQEFSESRIDLLCQAGHAWQRAGDLEDADRCYRLAAECESEPGLPDPRVYYASFLVESYDAQRGNELLKEVWDSRSVEPTTYHFVAETLHTIGDYQRALNWVNAGLSRCYSQPFTPDIDDLISDYRLDMLVGTRARVRRLLEQPEDTLDELSRKKAEAHRKASESDERRDWMPGPIPMLYWPEAEFEEFTRRWPDGLTDPPAPVGTHPEYRRAVERALRSSAEGTTLVVVRGTVTEFVEFCAQRERDPSLALSQHDYAVWLADQGQGSSWPPGRNGQCWCDSSRKYKKCCGAVGFADTQL